MEAGARQREADPTVEPSPSPPTAEPAQVALPSLALSRTPHGVLALQRAAGNAAVTRLLARDPNATAAPPADERQSKLAGFRAQVARKQWGQANHVLNGFSEDDMVMLLRELDADALKPMLEACDLPGGGAPGYDVERVRGVLRQELPAAQKRHFERISREYEEHRLAFRWDDAARVLNGMSPTDIEEKLKLLDRPALRQIADAARRGGHKGVTDIADGELAGTPAGAFKGEVGHLVGLINKPLVAGQREKLGMPSREAGIAYAQSLKATAAVIEEGGEFWVYRVSGPELDRDSTRINESQAAARVALRPGVAAIVGEDGVVLLPAYGQTEQRETGTGPDPFAAHKEAFGSGLGSSLDQEKFLHQFEMAMRDTVYTILDVTEKQTERKRDDLASGMPKADEPVIKRTIAELKEVDEQIREARREQSKAANRGTPRNKLDDGIHIDPGDFAAIAAAGRKLADLEAKRKKILLQYPLLSRVDPEDFDELSAHSQSQELRGHTLKILSDIKSTRRNVGSGSLNLWALGPIVEATLQGLGVTDANRRRWVSEKAQSEKTKEAAISIALAVLQIGLSIAAIATTGPAGAAFAVAALGVGVADAVVATKEYAEKSAAANTAMNQDESIVPHDLAGHWAWVVVAWVGVGLDFFEAVKAVRLIKAGTTVEKAAVEAASKSGKVQASKLIEAAQGAGKGAADPAELRRVMLSALPGPLAKRFETVPIRVLEDEAFVREFGSESGTAVTKIHKGADGTLTFEVFFRQSGNPLAIREEAVHLVQSLDPKMADKMAEISEEALQSWATMPQSRQINLYKAKLEVELDAQRRLLDVVLEPDQLAEIRDTVAKLEKRLGEVEQAIADPGILKSASWWDPKQPPRLFHKARKPRTPLTGGVWVDEAGNPGVRGDCLWVPDDPAILAIIHKKGKKGVPYKNNYPDFTDFVEPGNSVDLPAIVSHSSDVAAANRMMAERMAKTDPAGNWMWRGEGNAKKFNQWTIDNNMTWHHKQGTKTLQLVDYDLHRAAAHTGGSAEARAAGTGKPRTKKKPAPVGTSVEEP